ncbi:ATP-binding protein [Bdellovibrionota bacterium FG-1]
MPKNAVPKKEKPKGERARGQLRIGDHWNAITILALSQSNPLKAIAEFVENSIDAGATTVHIFRGKKQGETYLRVVDNGRGIPRNDAGEPDFKYVATHIGDSIKRRIKASGVQGEFGIGLLSFWTVGERLTMRSAGADGHLYEMKLVKGKPGYDISRSRALFAEQGTELVIQPLLAGLRHLSGEKMQWYLGVELRNRLLERGVQIFIHDQVSRNEYRVEPQRFNGRRLALSPPQGLHVEIYVNGADAAQRVALYRQGTRVQEDLGEWTELDVAIWRSGLLCGFVDWPDLQLTPGSRLGVIRDERFEKMIEAIRQLEPVLRAELALLKQADEEQASRATYASLHRAFRDALEALPAEEYDWFDLKSQKSGKAHRTRTADSVGTEGGSGEALGTEEVQGGAENGELESGDTAGKDGSPSGPVQAAFFEFPGPLHSARIAPASSLLAVRTQRRFRAVARDRKNSPVTDGLTYEWTLLDGGGVLDSTTQAEVTFTAPEEPGLVRLQLTVSQGELQAVATATVTVTDSLLADRAGNAPGSRRGLPDFTYERAPGQLWRSRFDMGRDLILINSGHRDFLFASSKPSLKLKYLLRLFSKELVIANFPGLSSMELLDRLIEVSLRAEEFLR